MTSRSDEGYALMKGTSDMYDTGNRRELQKDAMAYSGAVRFLRELNRYRKVMPKQMYDDIKVQALTGDLFMAEERLSVYIKGRWSV